MKNKIFKIIEYIFIVIFSFIIINSLNIKKVFLTLIFDDTFYLFIPLIDNEYFVPSNIILLLFIFVGLFLFVYKNYLIHIEYFSLSMLFFSFSILLLYYFINLGKTINYVTVGIFDILIFITFIITTIKSQNIKIIQSKILKCLKFTIFFPVFTIAFIIFSPNKKDLSNVNISNVENYTKYKNISKPNYYSKFTDSKITVNNFNFNYSNLSKSNIKNIQFDNCSFIASDFESSKIDNVDFNNCFFYDTITEEGANISESLFLASSFNNVDIRSSNFSNCNFINSKFLDTIRVNENTKFSNSIFDNKTIKSIDTSKFKGRFDCDDINNATILFQKKFNCPDSIK